MVRLLINIILFAVGALVYSFLNVVIYRLPEKKSIFKKDYICSKCGHDLPVKDRIPVFSWIFLRGKCRYCGTKIPMRYALVELFGGIITVFINWYYGLNLHALTVFLFFAVMTVITFIDMDTMEIPPVLNALILLIGIMSIWTIGGLSIVDRIIGMFVISVPVYVLALFGGFGGGDVKLMFAAGFLLGWKATVAAFFIGIIVGAVYSVFLLIKKLKGLKAEIAFGPFLCLGLAIAVFVGEQLMDAYISSLGL